MVAAGRDDDPLAPAPVLRLATALVAVWAVARIPLLLVRRFNPDEFEHLHAAWAITRGGPDQAVPALLDTHTPTPTSQQ